MQWALSLKTCEWKLIELVIWQIQVIVSPKDRENKKSRQDTTLQRWLHGVFFFKSPWRSWLSLHLSPSFIRLKAALSLLLSFRAHFVFILPSLEHFLSVHWSALMQHFFLFVSLLSPRSFSITVLCLLSITLAGYFCSGACWPSPSPLSRYLTISSNTTSWLLTDLSHFTTNLMQRVVLEIVDTRDGAVGKGIWANSGQPIRNNSS